MSEQSMPGPDTAMADALRDDLAQGDAMLAHTRPILRHLLAQDRHAIFNDEVIARIRGMVMHCGTQLARALAEQAEPADIAAFIDQHGAPLGTALLSEVALLAHCHALALESATAERLHQRSGIDPVLSPLMQELAASSDEILAANAMRALAAQARFIQHQRRMELPLGELPGDLFHAAMLALHDYDALDRSVIEAAERQLRANYDEALRRVGQLSRLIMGLDRKAKRSIDLAHAGLAIFATGLAMASAQDRDTVILSLMDGQMARLVTSLRAAGLATSAVEEQFLYLHPDFAMPQGFDAITPDLASQLLAQSAGIDRS